MAHLGRVGLHRGLLKQTDGRQKLNAHRRQRRLVPKESAEEVVLIDVALVAVRHRELSVSLEMQLPKLLWLQRYCTHTIEEKMTKMIFS